MISTGFRAWQIYLSRQPKHSLTLPFQQNGVRAGHHAARQQPRSAPRTTPWFAKGSLHGASGTCHGAAGRWDDPQDQNMHLSSTLIVNGDDDHDYHDDDEPCCDPAPNVTHVFWSEALSLSFLLSPYPEEAREGAVSLCVFQSHF